MLLAKKRYMSWEEYSKLIAAREMLHYIDQTAKESLNNFWSKQR